MMTILSVEELRLTHHTTSLTSQRNIVYTIMRLLGPVRRTTIFPNVTTGLHSSTSSPEGVYTISPVSSGMETFLPHFNIPQ